MKTNFILIAFLLSIAGICKGEIRQNDDGNLRASAYPLITIDPYTSGWSFGDNLYDGPVKHWTGKDFPMIGVAKVDGKLYRFMGAEDVELLPLVKTSEQGEWTAKYTTDQPASGWETENFDDSSWKSGRAAFGTKEEITAKTQWNEKYIWVRREFELIDDLKGKSIFLEYSHDDDVIIYINGIKVVDTGNSCKKNVLQKLAPEVVSTLKKGRNIISAYCYNRVGGALLDFGLMLEKENYKFFNSQAKQLSAQVKPLQTLYKFECGPIDLDLTFTAPLLMDDLDLMSRPINYISYSVESRDGKKHDVDIYFEASPRWALDVPYQESVTEASVENNMVYLRTGSKAQNILKKKGDDVRIDWGYFYMVADNDNSKYSVGDTKLIRKSFLLGKSVKVISEAQNNFAIIKELGKVSSSKGYIMLGYDDIFSIQYFNENLRPYWNRNGNKNIKNEFVNASKEYTSIINRCNSFDKKMMEDASRIGGEEYAQLCALAYRQAIAAHKLVQAPNGDLLFLSKENLSNGSIGTVDITYPSSPMFLLYNTELAKGLLNHIFYYSESGRWNKPFAAHDVGTYPLANGQTYGGDMPVEESGNMLIVTAAIAAMDGNAEYARKHWDVLTIWTDYLVGNGLDPENQLCTDDFAGHFAHNANLSVKAILGIASYGYLADMLGKRELGEKYTSIAKDMASKWEKMANDGDHYRLTFDKPGTWSQKYNLVWDKILNLGIFSSAIAEKEIPFYLTKQNEYGLPLDSRETYTKTDWIIWTATLAKDKETFQKFISPIYKYVGATPDRIPMSDWVYTIEPRQRGFQARSVVGGYFIKMLDNKINKR